ncbi:hypothetical protein QJS10_CPB04g00981 [Acorus calamus]|uniref:Uncharacterized protein n=1 Tax=Acorus calamus TaxID=4465 RepID=A0AAV9EXT2_ACOCL|nr:hypothetical protein QJS10_CPB04g00981 [Acorus calamus]
MERCLEVMKQMEERAQSCYSQSIGVLSNEFVEMMLLDGCFIIFLLAREDDVAREVLDNALKKGDGGPIDPKRWILEDAKRDLLLIENPFFVVRELFELFITNSFASLERLAIKALSGSRKIEEDGIVHGCQVQFNEKINTLIKFHRRHSLPTRVLSEGQGLPLKNQRNIRHQYLRSWTSSDGQDESSTTLSKSTQNGFRPLRRSKRQG